MPVEFEEDEWIPPSERPDIVNYVGSIWYGQVPDGYFLVGGHQIKIVTASEPGLREKGYKTIGFIPQGRKFPFYFGFITPTREFQLWPSSIWTGSVPSELPELMDGFVRTDDPVDFGEKYAKKTGICWRCGKPLSREESVFRGMGPICWRQIGGRNADESE